MSTNNAAEDVQLLAKVERLSTLTINGLEVQVVRKEIKNVHIGVYPPNGRLRVAAPSHLSDDNVRLAVIAKLGWIKKQQASFLAQPRQSQREMVTGESHYLWGHRYRLEVIERHGKHELIVKNSHKLLLAVSPGTTRANRELVLNHYYRATLKERIPDLIAKWEPIIGRHVAEWGIKQMKTKWGSCNIHAKRIWLNLELAKKPPECLEYVLVHEMVHLLERHHNQPFLAYMDKFMPQWQHARHVLNDAPLGHEDWDY